MLTFTFSPIAATRIAKRMSRRVARIKDLRRGFVEAFRRADRGTGGAFRPDVDRIAAALLRAVDRGGVAEAATVRRLTKAYRSESARAKDWAVRRAETIVDRADRASRDAVAAVLERVERTPGWFKTESLKDELRTIVTGLTERDGAAVGNFMRGLAEIDPPLSMTAIETRAERYRDQLLERRIDNLARTELSSALSHGQQEAWQQAIDDGTIPAKTKKIWRTGSAPCPICEPMDGQEVEIDEAFETGDGDEVEGPPAHNSCECEQELIV